MELKLVDNNAKPFTVAPGQLLNIASAAFPFAARLGSGGFAYGYSVSFPKDDGKYGVLTVSGRKVRETCTADSLPRPGQPIEFYEFEGCPFCRKVREAVNILDLDVKYFPCPAGGPTWRPKAKSLGGKASFPYMVDPNTGVSMYESDDIIKYLYEKYGDGKVPLGLRLGILTALSCTLAMLPRIGKGSRYTKSKLPEKPLIYWGYEASPFCKVVRETLVELELPFVQRTVARGSSKRQELYNKWGKFQAPYIEDPNTGVALFESSDIMKYLHKTYAL